MIELRGCKVTVFTRAPAGLNTSYSGIESPAGRSRRIQVSPSAVTKTLLPFPIIIPSLKGGLVSSNSRPGMSVISGGGADDRSVTPSDDTEIDIVRAVDMAFLKSILS